REVDSGAETTASVVFRVLERPAAQHRDVGCGIEDRDIDCDLHRIDCRLVLRIEVARIAEGQRYVLAAALYQCRTKVDDAVEAELLQQLTRFRPRQQHRVTKVQAGALAFQAGSKKNTLIDIDNVPVTLQHGSP